MFHGVLFHVLTITVVVTVIVFYTGSAAFSLLLTPDKDSFSACRIVRQLTKRVKVSFRFRPCRIRLVGARLSDRFVARISASFCLTLLFSLPCMIVRLCHFVTPTLCRGRQQCSTSITVTMCLLFVLNILVDCCILFPFTLHFLKACRITTDMIGRVGLSSCVSAFVALALIVNLIFRVPILSFFLTGLNVLRTNFVGRCHHRTFMKVTVVTTVVAPPSLFAYYVIALPVCKLCRLDVLVIKQMGRAGYDT